MTGMLACMLGNQGWRQLALTSTLTSSCVLQLHQQRRARRLPLCSLQLQQPLRKHLPL